MKMMEAHYLTLKHEVTTKLAERGHTVDSWTAHYVDNNIGQNRRKRARWDALWLVHSKLREAWFPGVYEYANDDHIDTALRKIFGHPPN